VSDSEQIVDAAASELGPAMPGMVDTRAIDLERARRLGRKQACDDRQESLARGVPHPCWPDAQGAITRLKLERLSGRTEIFVLRHI
jgi:hypothetical protein